MSGDIIDRFMNGFILVHCWLAKEQYGPHVVTRGVFLPTNHQDQTEAYEPGQSQGGFPAEKVRAA